MGSAFRRNKTRRGVKKRDRRYTIKWKDANGEWATELAYADKQASQQLLAARERAVARGEEHLIDNYAEHRGTPLAKHLDAFCATIEAGGATDKYVQKVRTRLLRAFQGMRATLPADLTADAADRLLVALKDEGLAVATLNHYVALLRQFSAWGCERERWPTDPLRKLKTIKGDHDIRRKRRALSIAELEKLVAVARTRALNAYVACHPKATEATRRLLRRRGESRALAYQLAALAGLRLEEVRQLVWADINFDVAPARITIVAENVKSKREDVAPVPDSLADELLAWRDATAAHLGRPPQPGERVLLMGSRFRESMRKDSEAASIPWCDARGRFADYHALRHCYASILAKNKVHPKIAQQLLRHTDIRLTMAAYTHATDGAVSEAVAALPDLSGDGGRVTKWVTTDKAGSGTERHDVAEGHAPQVAADRRIDEEYGT